jgi:hypothetical protein
MEHWTGWHKGDSWCAWELEEYGTCCHDLALEAEAQSFLVRVRRMLSARLFFFWLELEDAWEDALA